MEKAGLVHFRFFDAIAEMQFVEAVYLFGSRARGDATDKSDIDLAIVCPSASDYDWLKIVDIIDEADTLLKIDCVHFDTLKNDRLKAEIERDKIIL